jgi:anti-anti-sigma regulatory factor
MNCEWRDELGKSVLFCSGEMGHIECANLRSELLSAMEKSKPLNIDVSGVTEAGTIFAQVLISTRSTAALRGLSMNLLKPSEAAKGALERIGIKMAV